MNPNVAATWPIQKINIHLMSSDLFSAKSAFVAKIFVLSSTYSLIFSSMYVVRFSADSFPSFPESNEHSFVIVMVLILFSVLDQFTQK